MAKAGRGDDQYMLRFPEGLRERIKAAAAENGRSINSEIISVLEAFYIDQTFAEMLERRAVKVRGPVAEAKSERHEEARIANEAARKAFAEATADLASRIAEMDRKLDALVEKDREKGQ